MRAQTKEIKIVKINYRVDVLEHCFIREVVCAYRRFLGVYSFSTGKHKKSVKNSRKFLFAFDSVIMQGGIKQGRTRGLNVYCYNSL